MPSALETLNKLNWVSKTLFLSHLLQLLLFMMRIVTSYVGFSSGVQFGQTNSEIADQKNMQKKVQQRRKESALYLYWFLSIIPVYYSWLLLAVQVTRGQTWEEKFKFAIFSFPISPILQPPGPHALGPKQRALNQAQSGFWPLSLELVKYLKTKLGVSRLGV